MRDEKKVLGREKEFVEASMGGIEDEED